LRYVLKRDTTGDSRSRSMCKNEIQFNFITLIMQLVFYTFYKTNCVLTLKYLLKSKISVLFSLIKRRKGNNTREASVIQQNLCWITLRTPTLILTRAGILGLERDLSVAFIFHGLRDESLQRKEEGILASPSYISLLYNFPRVSMRASRRL